MLGVFLLNINKLKKVKRKTHNVSYCLNGFLLLLCTKIQFYYL